MINTLKNIFFYFSSELQKGLSPMTKSDFEIRALNKTNLLVLQHLESGKSLPHIAMITKVKVIS